MYISLHSPHCLPSALPESETLMDRKNLLLHHGAVVSRQSCPHEEGLWGLYHQLRSEALQGTSQGASFSPLNMHLGAGRWKRTNIYQGPALCFVQ